MSDIKKEPPKRWSAEPNPMFNIAGGYPLFCDGRVISLYPIDPHDPDAYRKARDLARLAARLMNEYEARNA